MFQNIDRKVASSGVLIAVIAMYLALRLWGLWLNDLWFDEVFSVVTARSDWNQMLSTIVQDGVHPPLFYVLLKIWSLVNSSVAWLQIFPVLISALTLIPFSFFFRELKMTSAEIAIALFMIGINGFYLEYAFDLRMYGLVQLLAVLSLWLTVRIRKSADEQVSSLFIKLSIVNLLLVYTHYFGWFVVAVEGLYLLIVNRGRFYRFTAYSGFVGVALIPWLWIVVVTAANGGAKGNLSWLASPTVADVMWFYADLNGNLGFPHTTIINLLIFGFPVCLLIWRVYFERERCDHWLLLVFAAFVPVGIVFVLSNLLTTSVWQSRYLIIAAIPYQLLVVKGISCFRGRIARRIITFVVLTWVSVAGLNTIWQTPNKIQWSAIGRTIKDSGDTAPKIFVFENWARAPLQFYASEMNLPSQIDKVDDLGEIRDRDFWLVKRFRPDEQATVVKERLVEHACQIVNELQFAENAQKVVVLSVKDCTAR